MSILASLCIIRISIRSMPSQISCWRARLDTPLSALNMWVLCIGLDSKIILTIHKLLQQSKTLLTIQTWGIWESCWTVGGWACWGMLDWLFSPLTFIFSFSLVFPAGRAGGCTATMLLFVSPSHKHITGRAGLEPLPVPQSEAQIRSAGEPYCAVPCQLSYSMYQFLCSITSWYALCEQSSTLIRLPDDWSADFSGLMLIFSEGTAAVGICICLSIGAIAAEDLVLGKSLFGRVAVASPDSFELDCT